MAKLAILFFFLVSFIGGVPVFGQDSTANIETAISEGQNTTLQNDSFDPELREESKKWWMFLYAVFILIMVGVLKNLNPQRHQLAFMSFWSKPKVENEILEDNFGLDFFQMTQIFLSCLLFGWLVNRFSPFDLNFTMGSEFVLFMLTILAVTMLYVLKYFGHYIIGLILQTDRLAKLIVYSQSNMMYALAIILFPCLLVHYYVPDEIVRLWVERLLISLLIIYVVIRLIKSFRIYFELFPYRRVYIFIYLCTLEILPLLVLLDLIGLG